MCLMIRRGKEGPQKQSGGYENGKKRAIAEWTELR